MGSNLTLGTVLGAGILASPFISAGVLVASNGKYSNLVRKLGNQHGKQERTTAKATPTASQDTSSTHPVTGGCRALHWPPVPLWASLRVKAKPRSLPGPGHCARAGRGAWASAAEDKPSPSVTSYPGFPGGRDSGRMGCRVALHAHIPHDPIPGLSERWGVNRRWGVN